MSKQALPPNFVRRRVCRTSCTATARTCVRHPPGNLLAAVRRILFFVLERGSTPFGCRQQPQPFLHIHPWRSPTALLSEPPAAASTRTTLASRASCIPSRPTSRASWASLRPPCLDGCLLRLAQAHVSEDSCAHLVATNVLHFITSCLGAQLRIKPTAFVANPVPPFSQAGQFLLIDFILHVPRSFFLVIFVNNPAYILCMFCFLLLFPRLQLLLILSPTVPSLHGQLDVPMFLFVLLARLCCSHQHERVDACLHILLRIFLHSNLSRVGDRPNTCVDKSWSSFHRTQPTRTSTDPSLLFTSLTWP